MSDQYNYDKRGVSATKDEVHKAIEGLDKGLFEKGCLRGVGISKFYVSFCQTLNAHNSVTIEALDLGIGGN